MTYFGKFVETKSFNTKQCQAGLSSTIIPLVFPFLPKMAKNDPSFDTALLSTPAARNNFTSSPKGTIWLPTANFGPLSRGQPHSPDVNHCVLHIQPEGHREPRI